MKQLLIICPLESELNPLLEGFSSLGLKAEKESDMKMPVFRIHSKGIILAKGGHGKAQFGIQTQYLLSHLKNISGVICAGAGGALAKHIDVGDLVIGEKTIEHDYTERFDVNAKLPEFPSHPELINRFRDRTFGFSFNVHFGSLAAGDEDIVDADRAEALFQKTKSLAVAWEGAGGARASLFNDLPYLEIRAITDNARESVPESFAKNLGPCMRNLAKLIHDVF